MLDMDNGTLAYAVDGFYRGIALQSYHLQNGAFFATVRLFYEKDQVLFGKNLKHVYISPLDDLLDYFEIPGSKDVIMSL